MTTMSAFSAELIRLQEKYQDLVEEIKRAKEMGIADEHIRGCLIDDETVRFAQQLAGDVVEAHTVTGPVVDQGEGPQDQDEWPTLLTYEQVDADIVAGLESARKKLIEAKQHVERQQLGEKEE